MNLAKRIATALVCIPVAALLIHIGGTPLFLGVVLLAAVALYELNNMAKNKGAGIYPLVCAPAVLSLCFAAYGGRELLVAPVMAIALLAVFIYGLWDHKAGNAFDKIVFSWLAIGYIGLFFSQIICLRNFKSAFIMDTPVGPMPLGEAALWLALIGTWASDSMAYFVGMSWGRRRLCPAISPNKSWEGALGGFIGCILSIWLLGRLVYGAGGNTHLVFGNSAALAVLGILIAVSAPLGDLAESQLKRFCAVKDSGAFFPGHGGVLDRFDSILFVVPVVYIYLYLTAGV